MSASFAIRLVYIPSQDPRSHVACRVQPASFAWFTPNMYAPGLGFLMFAVGVNLQLQAFATVFRKPKVHKEHG